MAFLDLSKAFDTVNHHHIYSELEKAGLDSHVIGLIKSLYDGSFTEFKVGDNKTGPLYFKKGVKQRDPLSPLACYST